jgi:hypothetical protein
VQAAKKKNKISGSTMRHGSGRPATNMGTRESMVNIKGITTSYRSGEEMK